MAEISQEELKERVALLKKFKDLLKQQRAKFQEYLTVLEKQENSISNEDTEALLAHTELEQQVVKNIMTLQKVIVPMSEIYNKKAASTDEAGIQELQKDLDSLQQKVLVQNEKNRILLQTHITQIKSQLASLRNPYKTARSVYAQKSTVGSLVAVEV